MRLIIISLIPVILSACILADNDASPVGSMVVTTQPGEFVHADLTDSQVLLGMDVGDHAGRGRLGLQSVFLGQDQILLPSGPEIHFTWSDGYQNDAGGPAGWETTADWTQSMDGGDFAEAVAGEVIVSQTAVESHTTMGVPSPDPTMRGFWHRQETTVTTDSIDVSWATAVMLPGLSFDERYVVRGIFDSITARRDGVVLAVSDCDVGGLDLLGVNEVVGELNGRRILVEFDGPGALTAEWQLDCRAEIRHDQPGDAFYQDTIHGSARIHLIPD